MDVSAWLLESDPALRWQVLRDLVGAPPEQVRAERELVATHGWGARLLALQGGDGQWDGGTYWPDHDDDPHGQPWTATTYTLLLLRDFGLNPASREARRAVSLVREESRWEEGNQPFFEGETEPCINGMVVGLGAYFGENVDTVVERLASEQLPDGGWNCEAGHGPHALHSTPPSVCWKGCFSTNTPPAGPARPGRSGTAARNTCWIEGCTGAKAQAPRWTPDGCSSPTQPAGSTTCSGGWTTSVPPEAHRMNGWEKPQR
jgi:hypothetical protein